MLVGKKSPLRLHVWCGGARLSLGHCVDEVVHHYAGHVQVASDGVREVPRADTEEVAVPCDHYDGQFGPGQLGPLGDDYGPAVKRVESVCVDIGRDS